MSKEDAAAKGYELIKAGAFEVGLLKKGMGIRTWWVSDFDGKTPELDHPLVQKAIEITEEGEAACG
jgi:hypothetical protein